MTEEYRFRSSFRTLLVLLFLTFRQVTKVSCKNNLENHSYAHKVTTSSPTSQWSMLLDQTKPLQISKNQKSQNNTNSYSYGPTYFYSPSSYGQTSKPISSKFNFPYGSTSTTPSSTSPVYSPQVNSPVAYYSQDKKHYSNGGSKNKVSFPNDNQDSPSNAKRSGSGTVYYKQDKDTDASFEDRFKQNEDYEYEEESYPSSSRWGSGYPYYNTRKRIQHKVSSGKYETSDDNDGQEEGSRPSASRDKPTYSESPWRYGGSKYGGHGYYEDHPGWHSAYPYDYEKMQAYHSNKEGYGGGSLAFLLGLLPLGLLMAAMVPNVVPVAAAAAAAGGRRRRSMMNRTTLQYPVLEAIARFGVTNLDDPKCLQRIFCTVTRDGRKQKSNIVQKAFYRVVSIMNEDWVEGFGLKDLFRAVRRNQCETIVCPKMDKNKSQPDLNIGRQLGQLLNTTRVSKMK